MASSRSPFETLPMLIVHKIVEYLEGRPRASFDADIDKHNEKKAVLTPLLSVSECWRMAALESICDNCSPTFNYASKSFEVEFPAWPASLPYLRLPKSHLIKRVVVPLHLWRTMCDGAFCEALSTVQYENLSFPCANTLVLLLSKDATDGATGAASVVDQEKVIDFAQMLLRLTPAVSAASIKVCNLNADVPSYAQLYDVLVSELYKGRVTGMEIHLAPGLSSLPFSLLGVSGLASIRHDPNFSWGPFASLAYRNARTLKTLDIRIAEETNWLDLIYGGTETPAVYDSLTSLLLVIPDTAYGTTWTAIEDGVVPFPSLEKLLVAGKYPFDDDLLFRSNGSTLQHLRIPFSALARNILGRFGVLKRSGVTQMDRIDLNE
ncbi:hypothetical protein GGF42_007072, partial [Coemansia sp. RSA 2424]